MSGERLLAVVPARGGSKRIPRKNVRLLAGRPLIAWSIETGFQAGGFCDVLVSTDDEEIAGVARASGALVPWLRPAELATDTATTIDVLRHALIWYESAYGAVDGVVLLQPTSPLRRLSSVRAAIQQFLAQKKTERKSVVSVTRSPVAPEWCFRITEDLLYPILGWNALGKRSQDLAPAYHLNGSIYAVPATTVRNGDALVVSGTQAFVMDADFEAVDIDTEEDWSAAEAYLRLANP